MEPGVSIVVPVLNDATGLRRCLASLRTNGAPSTMAEVIVIDNGSTDGSQEVALREGATVLNLPGRRVGELRNHGAAAAAAGKLAFVDSDQEVAAGWLRAACELLEGKSVGAVGAPYTPPSPGTWVQRAYGRLRGRPCGQHEVEWLSSGNLAMRRDVFESLGGFDTTLEACEDVDLCQRLRSAGWRILSDERLGSVHHGDPATLLSVFRGELWRGRDNLRVSLRRVTPRGLFSIVIPFVDLFGLAAVAGGSVALPWGGVWPALAGISVILALAAARTARMMSVPGPAGPAAIAQSAAVALTYDVARALALVFRARHRRSR